MWVKKQVIMLPTNEKAKMWLNKFSNQLHIDTVEKENHKNAINQHLYFLSDEEIKEGDIWFDGTNIRKDYPMLFLKDIDKKIIAATDSSLRIGKLEVGGKIEHLPQTLKSFIEKFVEEYNKGNVITEVMVAYDHFKTAGEGVVTRLQVNQLDNTINIKPCVH